MTTKNLFRTAFSMGACLALLGGCSWLTSWDGGSQETLAPPPPQATVMETADATWMQPTDKSRAITHMVPEASKGSKDGMERLARLEITVGQMQNDMKTMMPVLNRLVAVQTDTQTMLARMGGGTPPASSATMVAPPAQNPVSLQEPVSIAQASAVPPPAAYPSPETMPAAGAAVHPPAVMIHGVRIGEHPGKTRIVLDASDRLDFSKGIDNIEHILTVDVPGAGWSGSAQQATPKSPLLSSWQAAPDGHGGTRFVMQLRKSAKIVATQTMPPSRGKPARILIDIAPL